MTELECGFAESSKSLFPKACRGQVSDECVNGTAPASFSCSCIVDQTTPHPLSPVVLTIVMISRWIHYSHSMNVIIEIPKVSELFKITLKVLPLSLCLWTQHSVVFLTDNIIIQMEMNPSDEFLHL